MNLSKNCGKTLERILVDTAKEIAADKKAESLEQVKGKIKDSSEKILSFYDALNAPGVGLIAEIKECSPSKGPMNPRNVRNAAEAYKNSHCVRAISVLTSRTNFGQGMTPQYMLQVKRTTGKPVLRKDFICDEYQIYQARAYGADAILLMAHVLKQQELKRLFSIATDLGMDVLFETHAPEEINKIPEGARIYGINSRMWSEQKFKQSRALGLLKRFGIGEKDTSVDLNRFSYCDQLPKDAMKIAESGVSPETCGQVFADNFNAILVGTSLLFSNDPIENTLKKFELELQKIELGSSATSASKPEHSFSHAHA